MNFDFLKDIKTILDKNAEISKLKQENFNVFSILRKEHDEQFLHSAFLSELLNPNGCHDLGNAFLKIFVEKLKIEKSILNLDNNITVKTEHYI